MVGSSGGAYVPKFGTFKAKKSNLKTNDAGTKHDERRTQVDKHRSKEHSAHAARPYPRIQDGVPPKKPSSDSELFFIDVRGDPKNVEYGSLHRPAVPFYHRAGSGCVIGAPSYFKIDRKASTDKTVVFYNTRPDLTGSTPCARNNSTDEPQKDERVIQQKPRAPAVAVDTEPQQDFLRLEHRPSPAAPSMEVGDGIWEFIEQGSESAAEGDAN